MSLVSTPYKNRWSSLSYGPFQLSFLILFLSEPWSIAVEEWRVTVSENVEREGVGKTGWKNGIVKGFYE